MAVLVAARQIAAARYLVLVEAVTADATDVILCERLGGVVPAGLIFFRPFLVSISQAVFRFLFQKVTLLLLMLNYQMA